MKSRSSKRRCGRFSLAPLSLLVLFLEKRHQDSSGAGEVSEKRNHAGYRPSASYEYGVEDRRGCSEVLKRGSGRYEDLSIILGVPLPPDAGRGLYRGDKEAPGSAERKLQRSLNSW